MKRSNVKWHAFILKATANECGRETILLGFYFVDVRGSTIINSLCEG